MWLSLVERLVRDQDVAGSNPVIPTLLAIGVIGNMSDSDSEVPGSSPGSPATLAGSSKVREQAVTAMRVKASANNP